MRNPGGTRRLIARSSALVASLALLGPLAGLTLEIIIGWRLGSSAPVDAYRAAYVLIGVGYLFAGFLLPHLIIPVVSQLSEQKREVDGWRAAFTAGYVLASFGLLLFVFTFGNPVGFFGLLAPGIRTINKPHALLLLSACNFALVCTLSCGVLAGLLQIYNSFLIPALSQTLFNLSMCVALLALSRFDSYTFLAVGIVSGSVLMLSLHLIALIRIARSRHIILLRAIKPTLDRGTLRLVANGYPLLFIVASTILANIVVTRHLSMVGQGAIAQFGYAGKLLIITAIAPTALATVIFPTLARVHAEADPIALRQIANRAIRMMIFLTAPLSTVLFLLAGPLVDLCFNRGSMTPWALEQIKIDFGLLLLQTVPGNVNIFLQKLSFALNDTKSSAIFSVLSLILFALFLGPASSHYGNAGVLSVYAAVQTIIPVSLLFYQIRRFHVIPPHSLLRSLGLVVILCIGITPPVLIVRYLFAQTHYSGFIPFFLELTVGFLVALVSGWTLARILGIEEIKDMESHFLTWGRRASVAKLRFTEPNK